MASFKTFRKVARDIYDIDVERAAVSTLEWILSVVIDEVGRPAALDELLALSKEQRRIGSPQTACHLWSQEA